MKLKFIVAIVMCVAFTLSVKSQTNSYPGGKGWQPGPARYGSELVRDVFIPLEDGNQLEAKISYPTDLTTGKRSNETFPVLVELTPYDGEGEAERLPHAYFTKHGYITVLVHPRGSGKSTGELGQFSSQDGLDGVQVVRWASHLDGGDGRVGFYGASYPGAEGLATAAKVGKSSPLKAVVAASIGMDAQYRQAWTNNGIPSALMGVYPPHAQSGMGNNPGAGKHFTDFANDFWAGGTSAYDSDFWQDRIPLRWSKDIVENGIPVLQWGGWDDLNETGAIRGYVSFQNTFAGRDYNLPMQSGQSVTPRYQLVIGNWPHGVGMDIGMWLEWFDTWIKGIDTGLQEVATPLHLYELGSDKWVNMSTYPATDNYTSFYLSADGSLAAEEGTQGEQHLRYDAKPNEKDGRIQFETAPVAEGMTIAGPVSLDFYAKSTNTNLLMLARLYDAAPDGTMTMITKGAVLGSLSALNEAASWKDKKGVITWPYGKLDKDIYLTPGKVQRFQMSLEPIQYGVKPGHTLRLIVTSQSMGSDTPGAFLMSEPSGKLTAPQQTTVPGGEYTLLMGGNTPSVLNLPRMAYDACPPTLSGPSQTAWSEHTRAFDTSGYSLPLVW